MLQVITAYGNVASASVFPRKEKSALALSWFFELRIGLGQ